MRSARRIEQDGLIFETGAGTSEMTFEHLQDQSRRLANALSAQRNHAGRPDRHPAAAMPGDGDRPSRRLSARRDCVAALHFVRAGGDRIPSERQRREGRRLECGGRRKAARRRRQVECAAPSDLDRRSARRQRARLDDAHRASLGRQRDGPDERRRSRHHRLHLGDDGKSQGRALCSPRAARPPSRRRASA